MQVNDLPAPGKDWRASVTEQTVRLGESARGYVEEVVTADTLRAMAAALMPPGHREGVARNRRAAAILVFGIFCPFLRFQKLMKILISMN